MNYTLAWFGLMVIAILNGSLRTFGYGKFMPEIRAHQLSTLTGIILIGVAIYFMNLLWPINSSQLAFSIGIIWLGMTILFEFVFGHFVMKHPWKKLFLDYRIDKGRVWGLFLIWIFIAPWIIYRYF
ncbi:MAG: hypothetical protein R2764_11460 [Bacteroidales bacterium]